MINITNGSKNYRNKIKDFSHIENVTFNKKDQMEWKEKWDEEKNMKECTKWGRVKMKNEKSIGKKSIIQKHMMV